MPYKNFLRKFARSTKPGTSLLVALGLTTIIVLVSLGVTTVVVSSIRESANVTGANQAYYAAEGALEEGLLANQNQGAGYTVGTTTVSTKQPTSNYSISGQVPVSTKYLDGSYGIPTPGTGDIGANCDALNPDTKDPFWYDPDTKLVYSSDPGGTSVQYADPKDNPCNWNKLKVGESVAIPLYYTDATGPHNIFNSQSQTFTLRVRTGCTDGNIICSPRPNLDTSNGDPKYNHDDPIVSWQITGESSDGSKNYALGPYFSFNAVAIPPAWNLNTSVIHEGKINNAEGAGFSVVSQSSFGLDLQNCRGSIIKFLTNVDSITFGCPPAPNWSAQGITKPVFKLSAIHSLDEYGAGKIPYLEYQIITDSTLPSAPTDTSQTITAEGYSGTFKQVLEVKNPQEAGLLQYVIQQ